MKQLLVPLLFLIALPFTQDRLTGQSSIAPLEDLSYAEYPPYDQQVWLRLRDGMVEKADRLLIAKMPETADAVLALTRRNRMDDAERTALRIVETHPEEVPHVFDALMSGASRLRASDQPRLKEVMGTVADAARNRLPDLPRALAAEVTYSLVDVDNRLGRQSPSSLTKMTALAEEYAGTEAALNAEFRIALSSSNVQARIPALDRLIARYPGTAVAAKSLYQKGFDISHNLSVRSVDPTYRFMQLFDIVKELESGKYPPCEWTEKAASLIPGFAFEPKYAPENIPRLLEAYRAFVEKHPKLDEQNPLANGAGHIITWTMRELYQVTGEGDRGVERELLNFEKQAQDLEALRYVRALFYMGRMVDAAPAERARLAQQAADLLRGVHAHGRGLWARKSLATLASLYYWQEDYEKAREQYRTYVDSYPRTAYAWVAALRIGACDENLGRWQDALKSYTAAAARYSAVPSQPFSAMASRPAPTKRWANTIRPAPSMKRRWTCGTTTSANATSSIRAPRWRSRPSSSVLRSWRRPPRRRGAILSSGAGGCSRRGSERTRQRFWKASPSSTLVRTTPPRRSTWPTRRGSTRRLTWPTWRARTQTRPRRPRSSKTSPRSRLISPLPRRK